MSSTPKPLPALPRRPVDSVLTTLTVEAKAHLSRFIRHSFEDDRHAFSERKSEAWAVVLEDVLDELAQCITRGGWLTGIKRARTSRRIRRAAESRKMKEERTKKEKDSSGASKGKRKRIGLPVEEEAPPDVGSASSKSRTSDTLGLALTQIRQLVSHPAVPTPKPSAKHLILSVVPLGSRFNLTTQDTVSDFLTTNIGCVFSAGTFFVPVAERSADSVILYGVHEWDAQGFSSNDNAIKLVGGTFSFKGVNSAVEHQILFKVLRLAIYVHLSLLLEQHFLADSNVELHFPKPRISPSTLSFPMSPTSDLRTPSDETKPKNRTSFLPLGFLSFFSKKSGSPVHRATTIGPVVGRGGSLDLGLPMPVPKIPKGPRSSEDVNSSRFHRFSFLPENPFMKSVQEKDDSDPPFASALKRIEKGRDFLSTSTGVTFSPPSLIAALAEQELKEPSRRLKGDERAGLTSILGWDGKDARGKGMSGTLGFVRQQTFSVLYSRHIPSALTASSTTSETSSVSSRRTSVSSASRPALTFSTCDRPRWKTYRYYSRDEGMDASLGETITDLASGSQNSCDFSTCQFKRREHELRLTHGGSRIVVHVDALGQGEIEESSNVDVWESCKICGAETLRSQMSDGTYLFSFAKFLEVLIYSPVICTLTPTLCEHTTPPPRPWSAADIPLPRSRFNIIRHFSYQSSVVSFTLSAIDDIFELRVPRLQIVRSSGGDKTLERRASSSRLDRPGGLNLDEDKKVLRREMMAWWMGLSDHMDKIEKNFTGDNLAAVQKALPRLPSSDEDYEDIEHSITPKASRFLPNSRLNSPASENTLDRLPIHDAASSEPTPFLTKASDPTQLLSSLRHSFQRTEQSLYAQLSKTPVSSLNDVRRSFLSAARGARGRLSAWQNKHMMKGHVIDESLNVEEPEWWGRGCHAVPGGNIIVREDDWGSIIAFTLSSADYHQELANISMGRARSNTDYLGPPVFTPTPVSPSSATFSSSFFPNKLFTSAVPSHPDPDQDDIVWHEPEPYSAVISRKQHPRDPTSLLSIRDVLRQKSPMDGPSGLPFGGLGGLGSRGTVTPPSAWAKPAVEVNKQAADGEVSGLPEIVESVGKMLQEMEAASGDLSRPGSSLSGYASSSAFDTHIRRGQASSIISVESDETIGRDNGTTSHLPPIPPPKDEQEPGQRTYNTSSGRTSSMQSNPTNSSFTTSLTGGFTNAVRYMFNSGETPRPSSPYSRKHHLLTVDPVNIDDRPHIKYDWTIGKRLKFSCTVYYAKQFDTLRRRCGVDDVFLKSLGRSTNWAAQGGKSKSNFWKTTDDRFIIKTLVNAWNVADLQVLIDLAPSYFRYMDATAGRATVLAKLLGFYTVEIRNLESGAIQAKADLLVMENLFYEQKIVKTFDLKGIQGRKVKAGSSGTASRDSKTLFDGEWIEGQQRTLMLVRPHSKVILREALKSDSNFLSQSNIMDYSLLLGVDEEKKQIACGLVDTIGSYTFAKTLEYKAKQGLKAGKDVTVIPPTEYQERFVNALDRYFLACPDKWSRPLDERTAISDPKFLPSVL